MKLRPVPSDYLGTVRASSWPALFDCAKRWEYEQVQGLRRPAGSPARIGQAIHKGTAVFDTGRMFESSEPGNATVEAAIEATVAEVNNDPGSVQWDPEIPLRRAEAIARGLVAKYCTTIAPMRTYSAVEVRCEALDIQTEFGTLRLTGQSDRIRVDADQREGVSDFKSGKTAVVGITEGNPRAKTNPHHLQVGVYALMAEQSTGKTLDAPAEIVGFGTGSDRQHIATGEIANPKQALLGTADERGLIHIAAGMLKSGVFPPNPSSILCSRKFCAGYSRCPYHA